MASKNPNYISELTAEKERLGSDFSHLPRLLAQEIERAKSGGSETPSSAQSANSHLDIHKSNSIRVVVKVSVPVKEYPTFNFVGKLLGPKGSSLKRLQEETQTRMTILGRGSMRDKAKEEKLRKEGDPKYAHLNEDLHLEVVAFAPAAEAHARMAHALTEVKRALVPTPQLGYQEYYDDMHAGDLSAMNGDRSRGMMPMEEDPSMHMPAGRPAAAPHHMMPRERMPPPAARAMAPAMRPSIPPGSKSPAVPRPDAGRMMPPVSPSLSQRAMYRDPRPYLPPEGDSYGYNDGYQEGSYEMAEQENYQSDAEYYNRMRMYEDSSYAEERQQPRAGMVPGRVKEVGASRPVSRFRHNPYGPSPPQY